MPKLINENIELQVLFEISMALAASLDLENSINKIFDILDKKMGMSRATLTILNHQTNNIVIDIAHGITEEEKKRGEYKLGEGITGNVIKKGQPAIIPNIGKEPLFLNKTMARGDLSKKSISFICVPIISEKNVIGAISVDKLFASNIKWEKDVQFLTIIASMIGQAFKLKQIIEKEKEKLLSENKHLKYELQQKYNIHNMVGNSHVMHKVFEEIQLVADSNATVLIRGESGTGKELAAYAIHYNSPRSSKPFVKINCGAIPENLLESELFGYEKGAFTGAEKQKQGKLELADKGTIFLDEIGELSLSMQVKLLRVLQDKEFERLGSISTIKVDIRIITATNRNLEKLLTENKFREDLYYRLNVYSILLPPLREKKTDILLLAEHFLLKFNKEDNKNIKRISTLAIDLLNSYHWPGNVRELENCLQRAVLLCKSDVIQASHLPPTLQRADINEKKQKFSLITQMATQEKEIMIDALKKTKGNIVKAAKNLGISRRILGYKMNKYTINYKLFRY